MLPVCKSLSNPPMTECCLFGMTVLKPENAPIIFSYYLLNGTKLIHGSTDKMPHMHYACSCRNLGNQVTLVCMPLMNGKANNFFCC